MAIGLNPTLDQFVNWANQDGIGKTDLVHAKKTQGTTGDAKIAIASNAGDGIGFFASRRRSADTRDMNNATRELFMQAVMDLFHAKTIDDVPKSVRDKMKLGDYDGNGHPLSAHRIRSVAKAAKLALAAQGFAVSGSGEVATIIKRTLNAKMATLHGTKDAALRLFNQCQQVLDDRAERKDKHDAFKVAARVAVLSNLIGKVPCWNCKSGKDRTGQMDVECKFLATLIARGEPIPEPGKRLSKEHQTLLRSIALEGGNFEIQKMNTAIAGFKTGSVNSVTERLGGSEYRQFHRGGSDHVNV